MEKEFSREDLKIMAYKEKVSELEEANADLRVELTIQANVSKNFQSQLEQLSSEIERLNSLMPQEMNDVITADDEELIRAEDEGWPVVSQAE